MKVLVVAVACKIERSCLFWAMYVVFPRYGRTPNDECHVPHLHFLGHLRQTLGRLPFLAFWPGFGCGAGRRERFAGEPRWDVKKSPRRSRDGSIPPLAQKKSGPLRRGGFSSVGLVSLPFDPANAFCVAPRWTSILSFASWSLEGGLSFKPWKCDPVPAFPVGSIGRPVLSGSKAGHAVTCIRSTALSQRHFNTCWLGAEGANRSQATAIKSGQGSN